MPVILLLYLCYLISKNLGSPIVSCLLMACGSPLLDAAIMIFAILIHVYECLLHSICGVILVVFNILLQLFEHRYNSIHFIQSGGHYRLSASSNVWQSFHNLGPNT